LIDKQLLEILRCPNCKGTIEYRESDQLILCTGECRFEYPVVDDIPHMLIEEARQP